MTRVGLGTDLHRLVPGDHLMLGGVRVPAPFGVAAHSDGDVLLHAVTDAVLGALAAGDIGELFPDTAAENRGRASADFLAAALALAHRRGYAVGNLDCVVDLEQPKLSPHKKAIAASLARLLNTAPENVSVKAKTAEGLGPIGEGRAIAAHAAILLIARGD